MYTYTIREERIDERCVALRDALYVCVCRISTDDYANGQAQSLYNIVMNLFSFSAVVLRLFFISYPLR